MLDDGAVGADDDITVLAAAAQDLSWLADARLDVSPEVVADAAVLRPLHAYALTHATGDPSYLSEAFLPTAHIEGYRDGEFSSWDLESFAGVFSGRPAPDEETRSRRVERLDVTGAVATATLTLHHGEVDFTDVFVLRTSSRRGVADRQQGLRATLSPTASPSPWSAHRVTGSAKARLHWPRTTHTTGEHVVAPFTGAAAG